MKGRRALVTGASGGLGSAIAEELAARGYAVVVHYRSNEEAAAAVVERIRGAGGEAEALGFDVTDESASRGAVERLLESDERPIGALVNNAGMHRDAAFPAMDREGWDAVVDANLGGFFNVTQPLVMHMVGQRWGRIVNVGSIAAQIGNRGQVNYAAAKAGLHGATRSLALELAKRKITVNVVSPGIIDTAMLDELGEDRKKALRSMIPANRFGKAEEVAKLVGFLCSDDAGYINGQVIGINGGMAL